MTKFNTKKLTVAEREVFEAAMEDVDKISSREAKYVAPVVLVPERRRQVIKKPLTQKRRKHPLSYLSSGSSTDVDIKTMSRLKRGQIRPECRLDLHGMSQSEAFPSLVRFVRQARKLKFRCILAITGKGNLRQGGGVLREQFPKWLNTQDLRPFILGFCEAQPKDGGGGAFYILIRRKRP